MAASTRAAEAEAEAAGLSGRPNRVAAAFGGEATAEDAGPEEQRGGEARPVHRLSGTAPEAQTILVARRPWVPDALSEEVREWEVVQPGEAELDGTR